MARSTFTPGITTLLNEHRSQLKGRRIALLSHRASVDCLGRSSAELIADSYDLKSIFSPEHGFFSAQGPGEHVKSTIHPSLGIPVHSLYGSSRQPTAGMMAAADLIICDLQDLGARPYTYLSTLRIILEACAIMGKEVIVTDRPIPLPNTVDGPLLDPAYESFVGYARVPMAYGMTPGETAEWLKRDLQLDLDLSVAMMKGYSRQEQRMPGWPPWISPSPGIVSWESAVSYTSTVFTEALSRFTTDRSTSLAFRVLSARGIDTPTLAKALNDANIKGVFFTTIQGSEKGKSCDQLLMTVTDPTSFRPVSTSVAIISEAQKAAGHSKIWNCKGTRKRFFDKLYGCSTVRSMLESGSTADAVAASWTNDIKAFKRTRSKCLLYEKK